MSGTRAERWTPADIARLRDELRARRPDWAELARALGRSERACRSKAQRLGLLAATTDGGGGYGESELGRLLGVSGNTVRYWRVQGLLAATARTGRYSRRAVRAFLVAHPEHIGERVDRRWLVELLAGRGAAA